MVYKWWEFSVMVCLPKRLSVAWNYAERTRCFGRLKFHDSTILEIKFYAA